MKQDIAICSSCPYYKRGYVDGVGPGDATMMFIGEAPGMDESFRSHRPFTGPAGMELDRFLKGIHINRDDVYITNVVKCNPPGNEDPKQEVIDRCSYYLKQEMSHLPVGVVVTLGGVSLHYFKCGSSLEMIWGIPQQMSDEVLLFPLYHPALGLHQTRMLPFIEQGFQRLGQWLGGGEVWKPDIVISDYRLQRASLELFVYLDTAYAVGVDTETTWDGKPLYVQLCGKGGISSLVHCDDQEAMRQVKHILERGQAITVMHNAMFDLDILHHLDIHPSNVVDTMVMAYLLQDVPMGLKPLAYRLCGMPMREYQEVIAGAGQDKARKYMEGMLQHAWPDPEAVLEIKPDGTPHIKQPQNISKTILRALKDVDKGLKVDLRARWGNMGGRVDVEKAIGPMPSADLRDVQEQDALTYACMDPDATRRVYPILKRRIKDEGLEEALEIDVGIIPMLQSMQRTGIRVDRGGYEKDQYPAHQQDAGRGNGDTQDAWIPYQSRIAKADSRDAGQGAHTCT